jgi:tetratricopeptide (TPR) repeat protein
MNAIVDGMFLNYPHLVNRPEFAGTMAWAYYNGHRHDKAKEMYRAFAEKDFENIPDLNYIVTAYRMGCLCVRFGDVRHAPRIYDILLPHASKNAVVEPLVASSGSVALALGQLGWMLKRPREAENYFEQALEMNQKMRNHTAEIETLISMAFFQANEKKKRYVANIMFEQAHQLASDLGLHFMSDAVSRLQRSVNT